MSKKIQAKSEPYVPPATDLTPFVNVELPDDVVAEMQRLYSEYLEPHKLEIPDYAMKPIFLAAMETVPEKKAEYLEKARQKFEQHYLGSWAKGKIKPLDSDAPPMPEDVKEKLKELNKAKREREKEKNQVARMASGEPPKKAGEPKKQKVPVFADSQAQDAVVKKYSWAIAGTFRADPDKPGGTILDIKCQKSGPGCLSTRTIHLADCFQVKLCSVCRLSK